MKTGNVRLGHATNSSSSHSIVIVDPRTTVPNGQPVKRGEYGWENFVLTAPEDKMAYLAAAIAETLQAYLPMEIVNQIMAEQFPGLGWREDWYVDHASRIDLPLDAVTRQPSLEFLQDLKHFLSRQDVIVTGGTDDSYEPPIWVHGKHLDFPTVESYYPMLATKNEDWWTLYTPETGAKTRFSFENNPAPLVRSTVPELVDLKITDYCPFGCTFCYQNSTRDGQHAPLEVVQRYLKVLAQVGTFEVALGGGEPLLHPDFIEILKIAHELGITPNFTTKVHPRMWGQELKEAVKAYCGNFAMSVNSWQDIEELAQYKELVRANKGRWPYSYGPVVHYVIGTGPLGELKLMIHTCNTFSLPLTLLGFKTTGRGEFYLPEEFELPLGLLEESQRLSVDTAFVKQYKNTLENINKLFIVPEEGRFNMYIDAVTNKAAASSYSGQKADCTPETVLDIYRELEIE